MTRACAMRCWRKLMPGPPPDLWPLFLALDGLPCGVIRGANSDILSAETFATMMQRRLPALQAAEITSRGHVPFLDEPEASRPDPFSSGSDQMTSIAMIEAAAERLKGHARLTPAAVLALSRRDCRAAPAGETGMPAAHRIVQVPRRLVGGLRAAGTGPQARRDRLFQRQPCAGGRPMPPAQGARRACGDRHADGRAAAEDRRTPAIWVPRWCCMTVPAAKAARQWARHTPKTAG